MVGVILSFFGNVFREHARVVEERGYSCRGEPKHGFDEFERCSADGHPRGRVGPVTDKETNTALEDSFAVFRRWKCVVALSKISESLSR
jgi:hypothetical protein